MCDNFTFENRCHILYVYINAGHKICVRIFGANFLTAKFSGYTVLAPSKVYCNSMEKPAHNIVEPEDVEQGQKVPNLLLNNIPFPEVN